MNRYFSTDQSHLWLPYKGQPNKIKVECEFYIKHTVTKLNDSNELIMFSRYILGNLSFDTFFEELEAELSPPMNLDNKYELLLSNQIVDLNCTLVDHSNDASIGCCTLVNSSFTNHCTQLTNHNLWTLYFDTSRNTHGVDVGYLLEDPCDIRTYFSYHLESKCTKNDVEYEALIQGLRKEIYLKVKCIEAFGDSCLVIKQVRNSMFCTSYHLRNYQLEVWSLINKFELFNIKFIPHVDNYDTSMLIKEVSNLNLDDGSIVMNFFVETCRPLIPSTYWTISNDDQHIGEHLLSKYTSKGQIINEEQHVALLQAPISDEKTELRDLLSNYIIRLERHFGLHDIVKREMNGSLQ